MNYIWYVDQEGKYDDFLNFISMYFRRIKGILQQN